LLLRDSLRRERLFKVLDLAVLARAGRFAMRLSGVPGFLPAGRVIRDSINSSSAALSSASPLGRKSWRAELLPEEGRFLFWRFMMQHYATGGGGAKE
jgi:hypothetical protein